MSNCRQLDPNFTKALSQTEENLVKFWLWQTLASLEAKEPAFKKIFIFFFTVFQALLF